MHGINGVWALMKNNNANKGEPCINLATPYKESERPFYDKRRSDFISYIILLFGFFVFYEIHFSAFQFEKQFGICDRTFNGLPIRLYCNNIVLF